MADLRAVDLRGVLRFLELAAANDGPLPVNRPAVQQLAQLIPCDVAEYFEFGVADWRVLCDVTNEDVEVSPELDEALHSWGFQNPLGASRRTPADGALRLSQVVKRRALERLEFHDAYLRPLHIDDVLKLWVPVGNDVIACVQLVREGRSFTLRDEQVLAMLPVHLAHHRRSAEARRAATTTMASLAPITAREAEILSLVAIGKRNQEIADALFIAQGTVRKHLEHIYDKLEVRSRAGAVARWLPSRNGWH